MATYAICNVNGPISKKINSNLDLEERLNMVALSVTVPASASEAMKRSGQRGKSKK
jgi:hypothetical protein